MSIAFYVITRLIITHLENVKPLAKRVLLNLLKYTKEEMSITRLTKNINWISMTLRTIRRIDIITHKAYLRKQTIELRQLLYPVFTGLPIR